jgi:hypothetical protein
MFERELKNSLITIKKEKKNCSRESKENMQPFVVPDFRSARINMHLSRARHQWTVVQPT